MRITKIENIKSFRKELKNWNNGTCTRYELTQYQVQGKTVIGYDKKGNEYIITLSGSSAN